MPVGPSSFSFGDCRICRDKATGVHYGVATCEGCKGFFKRSIPKADKYKCFFGGQCAISPQNRNRCKACRFSRCIAMGMSVDAVKMGRIPKVDKGRALEASRRDSEEQIQSRYVAQQESGNLAFPMKSPFCGSLPSLAPTNDKTMGSNVPFMNGSAEYHMPQRTCANGAIGRRWSTAVCPDNNSLFTSDRVYRSSSQASHFGDSDKNGQITQQNGFFQPDMEVPYTQPQVRARHSSVDNHNHGAFLLGDSFPEESVDAQSLPFTTSEATSQLSPHQNVPTSSAFNPLAINKMISHVIESGQGEELQKTLMKKFFRDETNATDPPFNNDNHLRADCSFQDGSNQSMDDSEPSLFNMQAELNLNFSSATSSFTGDEGNFLGSFNPGPSAWQEMPPEISTRPRQLGNTSLYPEHYRSTENVNAPKIAPSRKFSCPVGSLTSANSSNNNHVPHMANLHEFINLDDVKSGIKDESTINGSSSVHASVEFLRNLPEKNLISTSGGEEMFDFDETDHVPLQKTVDLCKNSCFNSIPYQGRYLNCASDDLNVSAQEMDQYLCPDENSQKLSNARKLAHLSSLIKEDESGIKQLLGDEGVIMPLIGLLKITGWSFFDQVAGNLRLMQQEKSGEVQCHPMNQLDKAKKSQVMFIWDQLMESIPECNVHVLGLCRDIPRFSDFDPKDQAILMQEAYFEIWLTMNAPLFQNGESFLRLPCKARYSRWWMKHFLPESLIMRMFKYAEEFNNFCLTQSEIVTICAIQLINSDRAGLSDPVKVSQISDLYVQSLVTQLSQSHLSNHTAVLLKILDTLPSLVALSKEQAEIIGNFKIDSPPDGVMKYVEDDSAEMDGGVGNFCFPVDN